MCPVSFSSIKPYGLANGYFTTDAFDRPINNLTIPGSIMDEGVVNMTAPGTVTGVIDFDGDTDDITVTLTAGQTYLISLRGTGATPVSDTFLLAARSAATPRSTHDDDGGNGTYSLMTDHRGGDRHLHDPRRLLPQSRRARTSATIRSTCACRASIRSATPTPPRSRSARARPSASAKCGGGTASRGTLDRRLDRYGHARGRQFLHLQGGRRRGLRDRLSGRHQLVGEIDTLIALRNAAGTLLAQDDDNNFPDDLSSGVGFFADGQRHLLSRRDRLCRQQTGGYVLDFEEIDLSSLDPLDAIRWFSADNIDTVDVGGTPTAYVYFGAAGEDFGEPGVDHLWAGTPLRRRR